MSWMGNMIRFIFRKRQKHDLKPSHDLMIVFVSNGAREDEEKVKDLKNKKQK